MTITWHKVSIATLCIDDQPYDLSNTHSLNIDLKKGKHKIEILISPFSISQFRKQLVINFLSYILGAVVYTIDDAFSDIYDIKISFFTVIESDDEKIDLDSLLQAHKNHTNQNQLQMSKKINYRRLKSVKRILITPLLLCGCILSGTFLTLGIVSIKYGNIGMGLFAVIIATLSATLTIGIIVKTHNLIKKFLLNN